VKNLLQEILKKQPQHKTTALNFCP